jgi:hypothetical protein
MAGWLVENSDERVDCIPVDDVVAHTVGDACGCRPCHVPLPNGKWLGIHHAFDGREHFEPDHTGEFDRAVQ